MEKKLLNALLATLIFFAGYSFLVKKFYPQLAPGTQPVIEQIQVNNDNINKNREKVNQGAFESSFTPEKIEEVKINLKTITYSATGGYLVSMSNIVGEKLAFGNIGYIAQDKDTQYVTKITDKAIIFEASGGKTKEYVFDGHKITLKFSEKPKTQVILFFNSLNKSMLDQKYQELFYSVSHTLKRKPFNKIKSGQLNNIDFAGGRDRYDCFSLLKGEYAIEWLREKEGVALVLNNPSEEISFYLGPQTVKNMQPFGLQEVVNYGFFHAIGVILSKVLHFFFSVTKSWGISILLMSLLVYGLLFPFTSKSTKALKKMQEVQPLVEELRDKHKDNPQKLNKEIMEVYKKHRVNPLGGCLPLFFQFPVFIALYQVLLRFAELKGASFLWIKDLSLPDRLFIFPAQLPLIGNEFNLLPLIIVGLSLVQQKYTTASSTKDQKTMGLFVSVLIGVIFYKFPACIVLYWLVQNLLTLVHHVKMSKTTAIEV